MRTAAALAALILLGCDSRQGAPDIAIEDAWARATVAGQPRTAAYLTISNGGGGADSLVSVSSPAGSASLHSTSMDSGVMRMRPLDALDIPPNSRLALKPGATHVMISGLSKPLRAGQTVQLDLQFSRSGKRRVEAMVRPAATGGGMM